MRATQLRLGFWIVAGLLVFLLAAWAFTASPLATANGHAADCEKLVSQQLHSPDSASFESRTTGDVITGTVTADNAYGTLTSSTYRCTLVDTAGGTTARLDELTP